MPPAPRLQIEQAGRTRLYVLDQPPTIGPNEGGVCVEMGFDLLGSHVDIHALEVEACPITTLLKARSS